jgi:two-component system LytT family sensor kinase
VSVAAPHRAEASGAPVSRDRLFLALLAAYLGTFVLLVVAAGGFTGRGGGSVLAPAVLLQALRGVVLWSGVCLAGVWVSGRFPLTRARPGSWAAVGAAALLVCAGYVLALRGMALLGWAAPSSPVRVLAILPSVLTVFLGVVGTGHALRAVLRRREQEAQEDRLRAQIADARLAALREQLHPHFLFNTLQTVSTLLRRDPDAAEAVLGRLSELLRRTLAREAAHEVPLAEELHFLALYVAIQQTRFGDRLAVRTEVDPRARGALVPHLVLQPLVENAIRHGAELRGGGRVEVSAHLRDGRLVLRVADDGPGLPERWSARPGGVGLANTRARLQALYGDRCRLLLERPAEGGLTVTVALPFRSAPGATEDP